MALVVKKNSLIFVCLHRDIIVYDTNAGKTIKATVPVNAKPAKSNENDDDASGDENSKPKPSNKPLSGQITHLVVSENVQLVAVTAHGDKQLNLFRLSENHLELISQRDLVRATSAIRFTPDSKSVLVADKTGDCFLFECDANVNKPGKWIFGHFSMVLDILLTPDQK